MNMKEIINKLGTKLLSKLKLDKHKIQLHKYTLLKKNKDINYPNEIRNKIRYNRAYLLEDRYFVVIELEFEISNNLNILNNKLRISKTKSKVLKDNVYVDR
jgi:hypothetical protein